MRSFRTLVAVALLVAASAALAGETGSISGKVLDANGGPLPGVTVKASGPQLPAGRTFLTGPTGAYNFQRLLPGKYTIQAELQGLGKASKSVDVQIDRDYQIELVLRGETAAVVEVTAESVDQKSAEVVANFSTEQVRQLPIARSYEGLLNLIPGAPASSGTGYVSVAGGTRQENKYLVDGVNIGNPGYGYLTVETNELDIADVSIKTGAISAEFGRASGAVVNAVTKSGTNDFNGSVRFEAAPASFESDNKYATSRDIDRYNGALSLGFPIVKDVLFGYVSGRYSTSTTSGQSATVNNVTTTQPDTETDNTDYFAKVTAYLGESFLISAGFRGLPNDTVHSFSSSYDAATAGSFSKGTNYVGNLSVNWFATKDTLVEMKYVHMTEDGGYGAETILADRPMTIDPTKLWQYGAYSDPTRNNGNSGVYSIADGNELYKRDEVRLTASQFLDWGPTQHQVKVGGGAEFNAYDIIRASNGWGQMAYDSSTVVRGRFYATQGKSLHRARTYSVFLQDTITWKRLSATLGVLFNRDDFAQVCLAGYVCGPAGSPPLTEETRYNFMTFDWGDQVQPRVGIVYNTELLKGDKFYTNYGEYAGSDQKSTSRSFAPYRNREDDALFSRTTGEFLSYRFRGSSSAKYIPPDLKAPVNAEWVIGYAAPVTKDIAFDVYYQYKNLRDPFEDTPIDMVTRASYQAKNIETARRVYRGYSLNVTKRYSNSWYADLSYTYSKLYGNWDVDYSTGLFNTSSFLEDGPGVMSTEPNRFGRLGQDRPHIFKLMASYDLYGFTLGGFLRVQSGTPWEARGNDSQSSSYYRYLEPAGSRRLPTWTNVDFLLAYNFALGGDMGLRLEGRVQNVFDDQEVLGVNNRQYLDPYRQGVPRSELGPQGTTQPNALFGTATSWAAPRRFVLSALFNF